MEPEDIETISFSVKKFAGSARFTVKYTETEDGLIKDLYGSNLLGPAIINGTPCTPGRVFTKKSFKEIEKKFLNMRPMDYHAKD